MNILSLFAKEMNRTISVFPKETGRAGGRPAEGYVDPATLTGVKCAIYQGSAAESLVADRYKTIVTAAAIAYPGISIPDGAKITTDDSRTFYCIHADDVMTQGEVLVVALKDEK